MHTTRHICRVLAAAVASSGFVAVPLPASAVSQLVCAPGSFQANADSAGNITVTCTEKSGTSGGDTGGGGTTTPPPPPPPPPPGSCTGFSKTLMYDLPWKAQSKITSTGFDNNAIIVARFTTPALPAGMSQSGTATIASAEWLPPRTTRYASISTVPCDLTGLGGAVSPGVSQTPGWTYSVGGSSTARLGLAGAVALKPGTTYYVNIVNRDRYGGTTCGANSCEMIVQLTLPTGM